jgi:hypothetical protein
LEFGALELGDRKGDVEVECRCTDPDPIVITDLLGFHNNTKALDHLTGNLLLVECPL